MLGEKQRDERWYIAHIHMIGVLSWRGQSEKCIAKYEEMVRNEPDNWWSHNLLALAFMKSGKTENAWRVVEAALKRFSGNMYLHTAAGDLCADMGRYDEAFKYWEMAIADDPTQASSLYSEAFLLEKLGRTQEALEAWRRIVRWHHEHNWVGNHETDIPQEHIDKLLSV